MVHEPPSEFHAEYSLVILDTVAFFYLEPFTPLVPLVSFILRYL